MKKRPDLWTRRFPDDDDYEIMAESDAGMYWLTNIERATNYRQYMYDAEANKRNHLIANMFPCDEVEFQRLIDLARYHGLVIKGYSDEVYAALIKKENA